MIKPAPRGTDPQTIRAEILEKLAYAIGKDPAVAKRHDWLNATVLALRDRIIDRWMDSTRARCTGQVSGDSSSPSRRAASREIITSPRTSFWRWVTAPLPIRTGRAPTGFGRRGCRRGRRSRCRSGDPRARAWSAPACSSA